jgi:hypothetical protein
MTTHAHPWLAAFADSLTWLARHHGRVRVLMSSEGSPSSSQLGLSADQARAVGCLVDATIELEEPASFSDVDIIDFVRTAGSPNAHVDMVAASLVGQLRGKFGEDSLPVGLEEHLAGLSDTTLSTLAARLDGAKSVPDLLGSHYPASEPLPPSLGSVREAPRDGTEVWLLVSSQVEMPVEEFVIARWDAATSRWITDARFGEWRRPDSDARGWLPIEAPLRDPGLRKAIRRRWHGSEEELALRLGDESGAG